MEHLFNVGESVQVKAPFCGGDGYPRTLGVISEIVCDNPHFRMYSVWFPGYYTQYVDFRGHELSLSNDRGRIVRAGGAR